MSSVILLKKKKNSHDSESVFFKFLYSVLFRCRCVYRYSALTFFMPLNRVCNNSKLEIVLGWFLVCFLTKNIKA